MATCDECGGATDERGEMIHAVDCPLEPGYGWWVGIHPQDEQRSNAIPWVAAGLFAVAACLLAVAALVAGGAM